MFDIKLYDETGERETIRDLTWIQMTSVQSVIARLHHLLGDNYRHHTKQVSDESLATIQAEHINELKAQVATLQAQVAALLAAVPSAKVEG